jgi:hypothetical protein
MLHVESVHRDGGTGEIFVFLDAEALVLLLEATTLCQGGVDLLAGVHEKAEVVVAR